MRRLSHTGEKLPMPAAPIRILHLIASNFVGGPEKQILHHARDMQGSRFEVWIGSFRDQPDRPEVLRVAAEKGLPIYESQSSGKFDIRAVFELVSFLRAERIEILCSHGFKANVVGALAKELVGIPQIAFCRGWTGESIKVRFYEVLDRRFLRLADRIVCVSQAQANYLGEGPSRKSRVRVVHNAMLDEISDASLEDRAGFKLRLGFPAESKLIGAVGRLSPEKGQRYLVDAAADLVKQFTDLKVVLLGEGPERSDLEGRVRQLGLQDVVVLPGFQKNVGDWMRAFDVLANCSLTEGIPNAILEAMAAGTPVVATAVGGVPELIKDHDTGILVSPASSQALASGLRDVLGDPELSCRVRAAGQGWVRTHFSSAKQRGSLLTIYREMLELRGRASCVSTETAVKQRGSDAKELPLLSIVVPVRNEEGHIALVLEHLTNQDWPSDRMEILVADGNSSDGTVRIVEEFAKQCDVAIQVISNPHRLSSAGRNCGARLARGQYIFFVDGHCFIPNKNLFREAVDLFEKTGSDCLCRPQPLVMPGNSRFQDVVAHARATSLGHGRNSTSFDLELEGPVDPASAGAMYRKEVFQTIGYYDETFDACEDVDFNVRVHKAGLKSYTDPNLAVLYRPRETVGGLLKQMMRYGRGRHRLVNKHPDRFSVAQMVPVMFVAWLILGGIASLFSPAARCAYGISLGVYITTALAFSGMLARRFGIGHLFLGPIVYVCIHFGLGAGYLLELFSNLITNLRIRSSKVNSGEGIADLGSPTR